MVASQQLGANQQTDVFVVGQNGGLNTFWSENGGAWNGPVAIGPAGTLRRGANLAVSQQFGAPDQTDVFVVDTKGTLVVYWVQSAGSWGGPVPITPTGFAGSGAPIVAGQQFGIADQTDVFLVDKTGQLNVFWVIGTGPWGGYATVGPPGLADTDSKTHLAATLHSGTTDRTDLFLVDKKGQINLFWVEGAGSWSSGETIGPAGLAPSGAPLAASIHYGVAGQTDVYVVDNNGRLNVFSAIGNGPWTGQTVGPAGVAPPGAAVVASPQYGVDGQTDVFVMSTIGSQYPGWPMVFSTNGQNPWFGPRALVYEI